MKLSDLWIQLESKEEAPVGHGYVRLRAPIEASVDLWVALTVPARTRVLVVALPEEVDTEPVRAMQLRGIDIDHAPFDPPGSQTAIALTSHGVEFNHVFAHLADDLMEVISQRAASSSLVLQSMAGRLLRWQRFLEQVGPNGLSDEAQAGLVGELRVLTKHILPALGPVAALDAWRGPEDAIQDFQGHRWAIEVKTTRQAAPAMVRIASERQLQDDGLDTLGLFLVALEQRHGSGSTLNDAVAEARLATGSSSAARVALEERLFAAGYLDDQADVYRDTSFSMRWEFASLVSEAFPRLTEHDIPSGVGRVQYSVSVDACREHAVETDELVARVTP